MAQRRSASSKLGRYLERTYGKTVLGVVTASEARKHGLDRGFQNRPCADLLCAHGRCNRLRERARGEAPQS